MEKHKRQIELDAEVFVALRSLPPRHHGNTEWSYIAWLSEVNDCSRVDADDDAAPIDFEVPL